jgi:hypothetical protein
MELGLNDAFAEMPNSTLTGHLDCPKLQLLESPFYLNLGKRVNTILIHSATGDVQHNRRFVKR